ncbi:STAS-like domain-containing protein [Larkinella sp. VNQ87]|uniref:STAS-like domain-containing protein n=1 Tax=Larkinella sp. VNQ87 TaxID=3400921 RepID=UPI003C04232D
MGRSVWFIRQENKIKFFDKVDSFHTADFCSALDQFERGNSNNLIIDFSRTIAAYPNGMLPVIASIENLRNQGYKIEVVLPTKPDTRKLFKNVNWAHYLSPDQYNRSESVHDRHLVTSIFTDNYEQKKVVDSFMDVILRNMELPKDIITGLEWSINEITDNVLNHSESDIGGYIQVSTYLKNELIAFAIADAGKGILRTLKEGVPSLRTDIQAIGEAVKSGVTRGAEYGQGNGLAGTLKITTMSGGSFEIISGRGRILAKLDETKRNQREVSQRYNGTVVCGQIKINKMFSISEALDFGTGIKYVPQDIIDTQYEMEDSDCLYLKLKDETTGFGSRKSGKQLRTKLFNLLNAKPTFPIIIDWQGIPVVSSSFADEFIGKAFLELGALSFSARVRNKGMEDLIINLIDKAVAQRLVQASDEQ